jgi:hypothetical protein
MNRTPVWAYLAGAVMLAIGIAALVFTWQSCGWKTLLLGTGGFWAAAMGLCD